MPSVINIGSVYINSPQQNGSVFFGETVLVGMDANQKNNSSQNGVYGYFDVVSGNVLVNSDNLDLIDGTMNDMDFKSNLGGTV